MTGCLPGLVTVDKGLVSWACCCPLWVGLYFYTGLAIIHVSIQSLRGCLFPSCLPAGSLETSAWTNVHGSCGVTLPQALSVPKSRTHASPQVCRPRADKAPHPSQPQASVLSRTLGLGLPGKMRLWRPLLLDSGDWHSPEDSGCVLASLAAGDVWFWASEPTPH